MKSLITWMSVTAFFSATLFALIIYVGTDSTASLVNTPIVNTRKLNIGSKSFTSLNPMLIEKSIKNGDLNSLRKITNNKTNNTTKNNHNRNVIKKYLLDNINSIDKDYIKRLRTVDLKLGNYVDTSKKLLSNTDSNKTVENIITPLAMTSSDYQYPDILNDRVFVQHYREHSLDESSKLFTDYRKKNKDDLRGAFSLLAQTEITDEIKNDVKMLFLQLVKAPSSIRVLTEDYFLESYQKISSDKELGKYVEYATVSYLLDSIQKDDINSEKYNFYFSKISAKSKFYNLLKNKSTDSNSKEQVDASNNLESNSSSKEIDSNKESSFLGESFDKKNAKAIASAKKKGTFSFGWVLVMLGLLYYAYKKFKNPFKKKIDLSDKQSSQNKEEIEFDEDLGLDLG